MSSWDLVNNVSKPWLNSRVNNQQVDGNLNVIGNATVAGTLDIVGNVDIIGQLSVTSLETNIIVPTNSTTAPLVLQTNTGTNDYVRMDAVDGLRVNKIRSNATNADLELNANGTGKVEFNSNLINVPANWEIANLTGNATFGNVTASGANGLITDNINGETSDGKLSLITTGTGSSEIRLNGNDAYTQGLYVFENGTTSCASNFSMDGTGTQLLVGGNNTLSVGNSAKFLLNSTKNGATQLTSTSTAVAVTSQAGYITLFTSVLASGASVSFNITNANIQAFPVNVGFCGIKSYSGTLITDGIPQVVISATNAGSLTCTVSNIGLNALNGIIVMSYFWL